jgi:hypothetical protein
MLVGFGTEVGVISPPELRDHIVAIAEDALEHHRRPPPSDQLMGAGDGPGVPHRFDAASLP